MSRGFLLILALCVILGVLGAAIDAATDPAVPACEQAAAAGYYSPDLYEQCLDDYRDAQELP